jgi:ABC-type glycerol-3-phosphate transport system substrate-binding protein
VATAGAVGAAALAGACAPPGAQAPAATSVAPPEVLWSLQFPPEDARTRAWIETWRRTAQATGLHVTVVSEGSDRWTKRQAEFAAGSTSVDIMGNQLNWVIPGGILGIFADCAEYLRRDKVDTKQFYAADFESWGWKGKQWAMPYQGGGEMVLYNKALFDARGAKYPTKEWTYDDLVATCQQLNDPANSRFSLIVGANDLTQCMGTFVLSHGGKLLNAAKDQALWGNDPKSIQGAQFDVDLSLKQHFVPPDEILAAVPQGKTPMELGMVAMEFNNSFRQVNVRASLGAASVDFVPPPKGPTGIQSAHIGGNAWSILGLSKVKEAAWQATRWIYGKDGIQAPWVKAVGWPSSIPASTSTLWLDQFRGTHIADCAKVWETGGHDIMVLPEGDKAWMTMGAPIAQALKGEIATRDAMQQSAQQVNQLFSQRPAAWQ